MPSKLLRRGRDTSPRAGRLSPARLWQRGPGPAPFPKALTARLPPVHCGCVVAGRAVPRAPGWGVTPGGRRAGASWWGAEFPARLKGPAPGGAVREGRGGFRGR
ncbi:hypothetical protein GCM10018987_51290 [Streptomyces cremeus]